MRRSRFFFLVLPAVIFAALTAAGVASGTPPATTVAIAAIAYALVAGAYLSERMAAPAVFLRGAEAVARNARKIGIALTRRVKYRGRRRTLLASSTKGACPLGLDTGATWEVDESGRLNRPICRPAALAMGLVLADNDPLAQHACICPRGPQSISFSAQPG